MTVRSLSSAHVSRRALVGSSLAGAILAPIGTFALASANPGSVSAPSFFRNQDAAASPENWRTWYLTSPDELRPDAPGEPTQAEIDEVIAAQADPSDETAAAITRWGSGPAVIAWSQLAEEVTAEFEIGGMPQGRFMAIYHTALHDAAIAAWDAQEAFARPSPGATSDEITPAAGVDPEQSSFPSEHAAVAGAAATVLAYLVPDAAAGRFDALADGGSRVADRGGSRLPQ